MATTEQFSLRWNNFHSNIASGFHELLEAADLVDVTLAVEGQFLHAHKLVLSICSPYFKEMFKQNPCKHPIIILKDVTHKNLKDILEFMYLGEVNVLRENLPVFLRTAELLQVKGLSCDDTQSNSSKSSARSNSNLNMKLDDDQSDIHDGYDEYEENLIQLPVMNMNNSSTSSKRSKQGQNSNAKKVRNAAAEEHSNKNQKLVTKEEIMDESPQSESPTARSNDFEGDDLSMEFKSNNDSGIGIMYNANNTESASQEQDMITFTVDERGHVYCPYCYKKFVNRYNLKVHIRDKHDSSASNLDCVICKKTMRNKSCLRVHMYHHRKQQEQLDANNQPQLT